MSIRCDTCHGSFFEFIKPNEPCPLCLARKRIQQLEQLLKERVLGIQVNEQVDSTIILVEKPKENWICTDPDHYKK